MLIGAGLVSAYTGGPPVVPDEYCPSSCSIFEYNNNLFYFILFFWLPINNNFVEWLPDEAFNFYLFAFLYTSSCMETVWIRINKTFFCYFLKKIFTSIFCWRHRRDKKNTNDPKGRRNIPLNSLFMYSGGRGKKIHFQWIKPIGLTTVRWRWRNFWN